MEFSFDVGAAEPHRVDFVFDQAYSLLAIRVDGALRVKKSMMFSPRLTHRFKLAVGSQERHSVVIEKKRHLLLGAFRRQQYRVLIDDRLAHEYEGR